MNASGTVLEALVEAIRAKDVALDGALCNRRVTKGNKQGTTRASWRLVGDSKNPDRTTCSGTRTNEREQDETSHFLTLNQ